MTKAPPQPLNWIWTFTSDRLLFRPFKMRDVDAVFSYASDPEVARYMSFDRAEKPEDTARFLEAVVARYRCENDPGSYEWAVEEMSNPGRVIGSIGLYVVPGAPATLKTGYVYARDTWGKGYATEALRRIVDFAFEYLGANRVCADHFEENAASGRVMEKVGMRYELTLRDRFFFKGRYWNAPFYSILREDWDGMPADPSEMKVKAGGAPSWVEQASKEGAAEFPLKPSEDGWIWPFSEGGLHFRPLRSTDAGLMAVMRWCEDPNNVIPEILKAQESERDPRHYVWTVEEEDDLKNTVGFAELYGEGRDQGIYDVRARAVPAELGPVVLRGAVRFAFERMGANRLQKNVLPGDTEQRRMLEEAGFTREGTSRQSSHSGGVYRDLLCYALLRRDWDGRQLPPNTPAPRDESATQKPTNP